MAACFLLFFAVNPILSVCTGVFAGKHWRVSWFQPMVCAVLFLADTWLFFDMGEMVFVVYAACYAGLGYVVTGLTRIAECERHKTSGG